MPFRLSREFPGEKNSIEREAFRLASPSEHNFSIPLSSFRLESKEGEQIERTKFADTKFARNTVNLFRGHKRKMCINN